jgi:hypothetical protein
MLRLATMRALSRKQVHFLLTINLRGTAMLKKTNNKKSIKIISNFKTLPVYKNAALLLVSMIVATPAFAEKALNYGDINDEDGKYVSWNKKITDGDLVKTSNISKSSRSKAAKIQTKKLSADNLEANHETGYGDLNQDED